VNKATLRTSRNSATIARSPRFAVGTPTESILKKTPVAEFDEV
jgi:hypothetical protein